MKKYMSSLALAIGMAASVGANASLLGLYGDVNTSAYTIPGNNDYAFLVGKDGFIGGHLFNTSTSAIQVTYEYIFTEAEFNNRFLVDGAQAFTTFGSDDGDTYTEIVGASGYLGFSFLTGLGDVVSNDPGALEENNGTSPFNFFIYFDEATGDVYLALDDSGAGPDDNHDDMIIRVTATEVPEPATLGLLGLGLLGAGAARRRSK